MSFLVDTDGLIIKPVQNSDKTPAQKAIEYLNKPAKEKVNEFLEKKSLSEAQKRVNTQAKRDVSILDVIPFTLPPHLQTLGAWPEQADKTPNIVKERTRERILHYLQWKDQRLEEATINFLDRYMQKTIAKLQDCEPITPLTIHTMDLDPNVARDFCAMLPDEKAELISQINSIMVNYNVSNQKLTKEQGEQLKSNPNFGVQVVENGRKKIIDAQPLAYILAESIAKYLYEPLRKEQKLIGKLSSDAKFLDITKGEEYAKQAWQTFNAAKPLVIDFADLSEEQQEQINKLDVEKDLSQFIYHFLETIGKKWLSQTELQIAEAVKRGWTVTFEIR